MGWLAGTTMVAWEGALLDMVWPCGRVLPFDMGGGAARSPDGIAQPGGQVRPRPPRTCRWAWCTLCPPSLPVLATTR